MARPMRISRRLYRDAMAAAEACEVDCFMIDAVSMPALSLEVANAFLRR
jgi:hypothetical protein